MNIINKVSWITSKEENLLQSHASMSFSLGEYKSLDDILTKLNVTVIIKPGIITRPIPQEVEEAKEYWLKEMRRLQELWHHDKSLWEDYQRAEINYGETLNWGNMPLRGLYDPNEKVIKLYPDEMMTEYNGTRLAELLVSTLAHETMHAYFDRPGHDAYPYAPFVEEPLAEFGMLLNLYETGNRGYYNWAKTDVSSKRTCYRYGAMLIDQHLNAGLSSTLRKYLEEYKICLSVHTMPIVDRANGTISLPNEETPVSVNGQIISPVWQNVFNHPPRYFYDENTRTLGFDGVWETHGHIRKHFWGCIDIDIHFHCDDFNCVYLGDHFFCENDFSLERLFSECPVCVSPNNKYFTTNNDIPIYKEDNKPALPRCGDELYMICRKGKWGVIDENLKQVVPFKYDSIWSFDNNGLLKVKNGNKYGFVNKQGEEQIPIVYDEVNNFENGVTTAKKNGMYGIIDEHNNVVHPFDLDYQDMREFNNGYAIMKNKDNKWGAIDTKGNIVVPCIYNNMWYFDEKGIAKVEMNGKRFQIDTKGNKII